MGQTVAEKLARKKAIVNDAIKKALLQYSEEEIRKIIMDRMTNIVQKRADQVAGIDVSWSYISLSTHSPFYDIIQKEAERVAKETFKDYKLSLTEKDKNFLQKEYKRVYLDHLTYAARDAAKKDALTTFGNFIDREEDPEEE